MGIRALSGGKQLGREVGYTLPSSAEVKNKQSHTSAPSIWLYSMYRICVILLVNKYVTNLT